MAKDPREYGYEGEMAKSQLKAILQHAKQIHDMLEPDTDLPEWVQAKITLAYDYIQTAADYMSTEMTEGLMPQSEMRYCPKCKKNETRDQCAYGGAYWDDNAEPISEEVPVNSVSGGKIAGMGVGAQGEPGVGPKAMKRYKAKNAARAPRKKFTEFIQGTR